MAKQPFPSNEIYEALEDVHDLLQGDERALLTNAVNVLEGVDRKTRYAEEARRPLDVQAALEALEHGYDVYGDLIDFFGDVLDDKAILVLLNIWFEETEIALSELKEAPRATTARKTRRRFRRNADRVVGALEALGEQEAADMLLNTYNPINMLRTVDRGQLRYFKSLVWKLTQEGFLDEAKTLKGWITE